MGTGAREGCLSHTTLSARKKEGERRHSGVSVTLHLHDGEERVGTDGKSK